MFKTSGLDFVHVHAEIPSVAQEKRILVDANAQLQPTGHYRQQRPIGLHPCTLYASQDVVCPKISLMMPTDWEISAVL